MSDWAPAAAPAIPALQPGEVLLVPVTRLYDCGVTVASSSVLQSRITRPVVWLHPATAEAVGLADCDHARLALDGTDTTVQVKLDATLPEDLALLPRSVGLPATAPQAVKLLRPALAAAAKP